MWKQKKTYVSQVSKIILSLESAPGQDRPTQLKIKVKIQGDCFAPSYI